MIVTLSHGKGTTDAREAAARSVGQRTCEVVLPATQTCSELQANEKLKLGSSPFQLCCLLGRLARHPFRTTFPPILVWYETVYVGGSMPPSASVAVNRTTICV